MSLRLASLTFTLRPASHRRRPRISLMTSRPASSTPYSQDQPAPPRLPPDQQAEFERLQRAAEAVLPPLPQSQPLAQPRPNDDSGDDREAAAAGSLSSGIRMGAPPEFEGDKNPRTGEVGGPKNEPLRWGSGGDWSYNGRVTDF